MSIHYYTALTNHPRFTLSLLGGDISGPNSAGFVMGGDSGDTLRFTDDQLATPFNQATDWIDDKTFDLSLFECLVSASGDPLDPSSAPTGVWLPLGVGSDYNWNIRYSSGFQDSAILTVTVREIARPTNSATGAYNLFALDPNPT